MNMEGEYTPERGPIAMGTHDSSVYLGWIQAMGEVLMNVSPQSAVPGHVMAGYGGLMLALSESMEELIQREREG